jgi:hypothetical protein
LALSLALPLGGQAGEERWLFLPKEPAFRKLIGDPREPQNAVVIQTSQDRFEGAVGLTFEFLQWVPGDGTRWGWGLLGGSFIELDAPGGNVYPERVSDWHLGTYFSQSSGPFSHRLEYLHVSSHLGDYLFYSRLRFIYTRESFRFTSSWSHSDRMRVYGGIGYWGHIDPEDRPFFLHSGLELHTGAFPFLFGTFGRGYFTYDLKVKDEAGGTVNQAFQWGFQWKFSKDASEALRLALLHYSGNAEYGQFYRERNDHWGLAVFLDP